MSHITRELEWEEYSNLPAKRFEWGDEKVETTLTENEYYTQRLKELWLYWLAKAQEAKDRGFSEDDVAYLAGKATGFGLSYALLCGFGFPNEDKR